MVVSICSNYTQFAAAIAGLSSDDAIILVTGKITFPATGIDTSYTTRYLHILMMNRTAELDFSAMQWSTGSDYTRTRNGLALSLKGFSLIGGKVSEYQELGDCIKPSCTEYFNLIGTKYINCGSTKWAYRIASPTIDDSVHNQVIGSHYLAGSTAVGTVVGNSFVNCALSEALWSHCIYVNPKHTTCVLNDFDGCGQPFSLYPGWSGNRALLMMNSGRNWGLAQRPTGNIRPDIFSGQPEHMYHFGNAYQGLFGYLGSSLYNATGAAKYFSDYNIFSRSLFNGAQGFVGMDGAFLSLATYLASWDTHSTDSPKQVTMS